MLQTEMTGQLLSNSVMSPIGNDGAACESLVEIPSGGFNKLWKTVRYGRRLVLKGLHEEYRAREEFRALLRKEFELGMRLDHPCVVRVWGLEEHVEAGLCIVMEYIEGETLHAELTGNTLSATDRIAIARQLVDAVAYIHESGVCHRDLKPDNIIVANRGSRPVLIDFGLGDSDDYLILKPSAATRSYGAPEQLTGFVGDSRSDVYSLGRILSEMSLPGRYSAIINRCLSKNPEDRPTAGQLLLHFNRRPSIAPGFFRGAVIVSVTAIVTAVVMSMVALRQSHQATEETSAPIVVIGDQQRDTIYLGGASMQADSGSALLTPADVSVKKETVAADETGNKRLTERVDSLYESVCREATELTLAYRKYHEDPGIDYQLALDKINERNEKLTSILNQFLSTPAVLELSEVARQNYEQGFWWCVSKAST
ncbi:MAG: serine/threonine protein kinase [Paramuribaculum sp.]|nr:serine/threonine protein kinase [Paramuribaculum sp.]